MGGKGGVCVCVCVDEPEKLDALAEIEILKNGITSENPLHDMPMPCPLGTVVRDAWRVEQPRREGEGAAQEKDPAVGVEPWHSSPLASTSSRRPMRCLSDVASGLSARNE